MWLVKNMGILSNLLSFVAAQQHDTSILFLEFEEVALVAGGFLVLLMYLFYVRYPYNKEN
jgi:hypothetical protein